MNIRNAIAFAFSIVSTATLGVSPGPINLACDITVRQWGPQISTDPVTARVDVSIEERGDTLLIDATGKGIGSSFLTPTQKTDQQLVVNNSNDRVWDISVLRYSDNSRKELSFEERIIINRYTGSIRINFSGPFGVGAASEGVCENNPRKRF